jgi:hypothetical protein
MKVRWHRHYEGEKKGLHFYSGEAYMKPEWLQCACEAHLKANFEKRRYTTTKIYKFGKLTLQRFKYLYLR